MQNNLTDRFFYGINKKNTKIINTLNLKADLSSSRKKQKSQSRSKSTRMFDNSTQNSLRTSLNHTLRNFGTDNSKSTSQDFIPPLPFKDIEPYHRKNSHKTSQYTRTFCQSGPFIPTKDLHLFLESHKKNQPNLQPQSSSTVQQKFQNQLKQVFTAKERLRSKIESGAIRRYENASYLQINRHKVKVQQEHVQKLLNIINKHKYKDKAQSKNISNHKIAISQQQNIQVEKNVANNQLVAKPDLTYKEMNFIQDSQQKLFTQSENSQDSVQVKQVQKQNYFKQQKTSIKKIENNQKQPQNKKMQQQIQQRQYNDRQKIFPSNNQQQKRKTNFKIQIPPRAEKKQKIQSNCVPTIKKLQKEQQIQKQKSPNQLSIKNYKSQKAVQNKIVEKIDQKNEPKQKQKTNEANISKTNKLDIPKQVSKNQKEPVKIHSQLNQSNFLTIPQQDITSKILHKVQTDQKKTQKNNKANVKQVAHKNQLKKHRTDYFTPNDEEELENIQIGIPFQKITQVNKDKNKTVNTQQNLSFDKKNKQIAQKQKKKYQQPKSKQQDIVKKEQKIKNEQAKPKLQNSSSNNKDNKNIKQTGATNKGNLQKGQNKVPEKKVQVQIKNQVQTKKAKNTQNNKIEYDHQQVINQIEYILYLLNQIGHFCRQTKKFYEKNKIQIFNKEYKAQIYYVWSQMCFIRNKCIRILDKKQQNLYQIDKRILKQKQFQQFIQTQIQTLLQQNQQCMKTLDSYHELAKTILPASEKTISMEKTPNFHIKCVNILQQQFKQLQRLYKKAIMSQSTDSNQQKYAQRLCKILQIFCLLKYLNGQQTKQYSSTEQITNFSVHYQNNKHLIIL